MSNNAEDIYNIVEIKNDSLEKTLKLSEEFSQYSRIGNFLIFEDMGKIFSVTSESNLSYSPFNCPNIPEMIPNCLKLDFTIEKIFIKEDEFSEVQVINKLIFKNSYIKIFYNSITESYDIMSAEIIDQEVFLLYDIHIGMQKKDFFNKIFMENIPFDFEDVEIFINSNTMGSIIQKFIFKDNKLEKIIMDSDYDWG